MFSTKISPFKNSLKKGGIIYTFYKPLFLAILCCGIDLLPEFEKRLRLVRLTIAAFNGILSFATIIITIEIIASINSLSPDIWAKPYVLVLGLIFKFMLFKRRRDILNLIELLEGHKLTERFFLRIQASKRKLNLIIAFMIVSQTILCILGILLVNSETPLAKDNITLFSTLRKFNISIPKTAFDVESKVRVLVLCLHNVYSFHFFVALYSTLSWHIKLLVEQFLERKHLPSFQELFKEYSELCNLIDHANNVLRALVLLAVIFISSFLYLTLYTVMSSGLDLDFMSLTSVLAIDLILIELYFMIHIASGIPETNDQIHDAILNLPHDLLTSTDKICLVMKTHRQLGLSLGGVVFIRRGIFLTLLGTIFTYCLLIKSFSY